jgi:polyphosphate kinase 2 (PPK2 family)
MKLEDKSFAKEALQVGIDALTSLRDMLYAHGRWGVLLIFQAMDAAGKDGALAQYVTHTVAQGNRK